MGDAKKVKKKCCHKFEKKGTHCSNCPLTASEKDKKPKKEKKQGGKKKA